MTSQEFKYLILQRFYQDMHVVQSGNYSAERYSFDGVDRSMEFNTGKHAMYLDWFIQTYDSLFNTYQRFADDASRELFIDLIRYRLAGHLHVRIGSRLPLHAQELERFKSVFTGRPSSLASAGMFGSLMHYDNEWNGVRYTADTLKNSLIIYLVDRQYFFERDGIAVQPEPGDYLIDGGAFTGDTGVIFSHAVGPAGRVFTFDPIQNHHDICEANFSRPGRDNVTAFAYGLSDKTVHAPAVKLDHYNPGWFVTGTVPLYRIDDLVADGTIARIDFIKLDVEGSELAALRGALASIRRFKPKLAISLYHKPNDIFEICQFVDDLCLGYELFLDHHTIWDEETVLYARVP